PVGYQISRDGELLAELPTAELVSAIRSAAVARMIQGLWCIAFLVLGLVTGGSLGFIAGTSIQRWL
ncbi:MAG: hypothetical protein LWW84_09060, partial [Azovibrio sp.]|nr:hypothetical protein [Azovibrio sp.]